MEHFPASKRLKRRTDFLNVYKNGHRYSGSIFNIYVFKHNHTEGRLGITVPRRVGKAVLRNRIKRIIREYFRKNPELFVGIDIVIDVKPKPLQPLTSILEALQTHLEKVFQRR